MRKSVRPSPGPSCAVLASGRLAGVARIRRPLDPGKPSREDRHITHGRVRTPLRPRRPAGGAARIPVADHLADRLPASPAAPRDRSRPRGYRPGARRPGRRPRPRPCADEDGGARARAGGERGGGGTAFGCPHAPTGQRRTAADRSGRRAASPRPAADRAAGAPTSRPGPVSPARPGPAVAGARDRGARGARRIISRGGDAAAHPAGARRGAAARGADTAAAAGRRRRRQSNRRRHRRRRSTGRACWACAAPPGSVASRS